MRHMKRVMTYASVALAVLLLAGCWSGSDATESTSTDIAPSEVGSAWSPGVQEEAQKYAGSSDPGYSDDAEYSAAPQDGYRLVAGGTVSTERMIITNSSLELRVDDVGSAVASLRAAVLANQGEIAELQLSGGDIGEAPLGEGAPVRMSPSFASVIIRVPATKLEALTKSLGKLGTVVSQTESSSDVTEQAVDMEARLRNLRAEEDRLRSFLERTNKVSELLAVERELARVRGDIESMDAQLTYLNRQVAKATLSVTLSEPGSVTGTESPWYRLREAFAQGVQGAIQIVEMLVTLVVSIVPLVVVFGGLAWALIAGLRRRHRRRAAATNTDAAAAEPTDSLPRDQGAGD